MESLPFETFQANLPLHRDIGRNGQIEQNSDGTLPKFSISQRPHGNPRIDPKPVKPSSVFLRGSWTKGINYTVPDPQNSFGPFPADVLKLATAVEVKTPTLRTNP
ncbi:uncharacterized protein RSE6_01425 [Rhynchosporium secalis]|uniref:Uncharacterized protein n=1 Tax=Rhynchosporium secalis TaxID=38038 RepID=A0A1E1LZG2_RHYSE|nr:uncharacterized protein RSE6_01425 [Rhynchosporium secalis]